MLNLIYCRDKIYKKSLAELIIATLSIPNLLVVKGTDVEADESEGGKELSAGERAQAMFASRLSKLSKQDSLFILDDVFQCCDSLQKEVLIPQLVDLARRKGVKVIFLTTDSHFRELLIKAGEDFGTQFKYLELEQSLF